MLNKCMNQFRSYVNASSSSCATVSAFPTPRGITCAAGLGIAIRVNKIDYNEKNKVVTLLTTSDNKAEAMKEIVISKMIKRSIPAQAIKEIKKESVGGGNTKLTLQVIDVIGSEDATKITKEIKAQKLKVQASIRGEEIRVTAKSIDDLQECIKVVKSLELELPLSFTNFS